MTSSRAAEKHKKSSSTKEHRFGKNGKFYKGDDEDDDEKDSDLRHHKINGISKGEKLNGEKSERQNGRQNGKLNDGQNERQNERQNDKLREREKNVLRKELFDSNSDSGFVMKILIGLEGFSLCASDLNVVIFFLLLPWLRQLWR